MPMPSLSILISKKKPSMPMMGEDKDLPHDESEGMDKEKICVAICESVIQAVEDRDARALCKCLKDLVDLLKDGDEMEEDTDHDGM